MRLASSFVLGALAGCGRVGFAGEGNGGTDGPVNSTGDGSASGTTECLVDDFSGGLGSWQVVSGSWSAQQAGPDGSLALVSANVGDSHYLTHPALSAIATARVAVDVRFDEPSASDFNVFFAFRPFTLATLTGYEAAVFPDTGDNSWDMIARWDSGAQSLLASRSVSLPAVAWRRIEVERGSSGELRVYVEGSLHLSSADPLHAPPFDVVLRAYAGCRIDNVIVTCTR